MSVYAAMHWICGLIARSVAASLLVRILLFPRYLKLSPSLLSFCYSVTPVIAAQFNLLALFIVRNRPRGGGKSWLWLALTGWPTCGASTPRRHLGGTGDCLLV